MKKIRRNTSENHPCAIGTIGVGNPDATDRKSREETGERPAEVAQHTPTPWFVTRGNEIGHDYTDNAGNRHVGYIAETLNRGKQGETNAEFIVRACNSHEKLLTALKGILDQVDWLNGNCKLNEMVGAVLDKQVIEYAHFAIVKTSIRKHKSFHEKMTEAKTDKALSKTEPSQATIAQKLPCGCPAQPLTVFWNPFNNVVQCHKCGQIYSPIFGLCDCPNWLDTLDDARNAIRKVLNCSESLNAHELSISLKTSQELIEQFTKPKNFCPDCKQELSGDEWLDNEVHGRCHR